MKESAETIALSAIEQEIADQIIHWIDDKNLWRDHYEKETFEGEAEDNGDGIYYYVHFTGELSVERETGWYGDWYSYEVEEYYHLKGAHIWIDEWEAFDEDDEKQDDDGNYPAIELNVKAIEDYVNQRFY